MLRYNFLLVEQSFLFVFMLSLIMDKFQSLPCTNLGNSENFKVWCLSVRRQWHVKKLQTFLWVCNSMDCSYQENEHFCWLIQLIYIGKIKSHPALIYLVNGTVLPNIIFFIIGPIVMKICGHIWNQKIIEAAVVYLFQFSS